MISISNKVKVSRPLVTVVTVCWNADALIRKTIESVLAQSYPCIEYIIVDGESHDSTMDIVNEYRGRITHIISEKDNGIYDAMNKGISRANANSKYITFLNAGDVFYNAHVVEQMLSRATSQETHLYGDHMRCGRLSTSMGRVTSRRLLTGMICHQTILFLTEYHRSNPYNTRWSICADYQLLLEMTLAGEPFEKVEVVVVIFDTTGISSTHKWKLREEKRAILKQHPRLYLKMRLLKLIPFRNVKRSIQKRLDILRLRKKMKSGEL